jgi:hypothetical protein
MSTNDRLIMKAQNSHACGTCYLRQQAECQWGCDCAAVCVTLRRNMRLQTPACAIRALVASGRKLSVITTRLTIPAVSARHTLTMG